MVMDSKRSSIYIKIELEKLLSITIVHENDFYFLHITQCLWLYCTATISVIDLKLYKTKFCPHSQSGRQVEKMCQTSTATKWSFCNMNFEVWSILGDINF